MKVEVALKKANVGLSSQQSHGANFITYIDDVRKGTTHKQWRILCRLIGLVQRGLGETTALGQEDSTIRPRQLIVHECLVTM